ncbi:F0F1-type ATP synthase delta subunit [Opitutaceae bacterium TAV1]|nr:F0F1-type ATP synthase delta subunit [Opitutaceae bacterium TAV1]
MTGKKQIAHFARQYYQVSLAEDGRVSPERVTAVLTLIDRTPPPHPVAVLKAYRRLVAAALARHEAVVEHAGPVSEATLAAIGAAFTRRYARPVTASVQPNPALIAGLRIRVGDDVYESTVAAQLAALASS